MIHPECATYGTYERCPDCGLAWCPRCRAWFGPTGDTGKGSGTGE